MSKSGYDVWCTRCGCLMKERTGKYGKFFGCTGYPKCMSTMNMRDAELQVTNDLNALDISDDDYGNGGDYDPGGDYD